MPDHWYIVVESTRRSLGRGRDIVTYRVEATWADVPTGIRTGPFHRRIEAERAARALSPEIVPEGCMVDCNGEFV
jgi:hypothetical protein